MHTILAIDAAWTTTQPSGVALLKQQAGQWYCVALAPSYQQFYQLAMGQEVDWQQMPGGEAPDISRLIQSCRQLLNDDMQTPTVITVDMPVSTLPITGRRYAENALTSAFSKYGCAAHSPSQTRPGVIADRYYRECVKHGYRLGTTATVVGTARHLLEVYPHPALVKLMQADYRLPYKSGKTGKFWPKASVEQRKQNLVKVYADILDALSNEIKGITLTLPEDLQTQPFSYFKRFEDAIDALVCGWIGMNYLAKKATAYGDITGAIWVPG